MERDEFRKFGLTSLAMKELPTVPEPGANGIYSKYYGDPGLSKAFEQNTSSEIDKMKKASNLAKNLGPGVSELAQETFKLLRAGDVEKYQQITKGETEQKSLEALRAKALKQREEFQNQIK